MNKMKIKVTNKKDDTDVSILDLSKSVAVRCQTGQLKGAGKKLIVVFSDDFHPEFDEKKYMFEEVEVTMSGNVSFVKRSIPEILGLYSWID